MCLLLYIWRVTLVDGKGNDVVTVTCPTSLFGVWSPVGKHAPFVCIEPWYGRCDRVGFNQKIEDCEYGNTLGAGESFNSRGVLKPGKFPPFMPLCLMILITIGKALTTMTTSTKMEAMQQIVFDVL